MNLKKALKEKNKLKGKIYETCHRISKYNISEEKFERPYDPIKLWDELLVSVDEMVALKSKIQRANLDVFDKIFKLSELKGIAAKLKYLNCEREITSTGYVPQAAISTIDRDKLIENIEKQIEQIQEELDEFNYRKTI